MPAWLRSLRNGSSTHTYFPVVKPQKRRDFLRRVFHVVSSLFLIFPPYLATPW
jgi:hypothetical protein